jgi:hypothetical protein
MIHKQHLVGVWICVKALCHFWTAKWGNKATAEAAVAAAGAAAAAACASLATTPALWMKHQHTRLEQYTTPSPLSAPSRPCLHSLPPSHSFLWRYLLTHFAAGVCPDYNNDHNGQTPTVFVSSVSAPVVLQGGDKEKKKIMKASEKFRFNFDWDNKEDTSRDLNPLYNNLHRECHGFFVPEAAW